MNDIIFGQLTGPSKRYVRRKNNRGYKDIWYHKTKLITENSEFLFWSEQKWQLKSSFFVCIFQSRVAVSTQEWPSTIVRAQKCLPVLCSLYCTVQYSIVQYCTKRVSFNLWRGGLAFQNKRTHQTVVQYLVQYWYGTVGTVLNGFG
jgi:hypothetical protein